VIENIPDPATSRDPATLPALQQNQDPTPSLLQCPEWLISFAVEGLAANTMLFTSKGPREMGERQNN